MTWIRQIFRLLLIVVSIPFSIAFHIFFFLIFLPGLWMISLPGEIAERRRKGQLLRSTACSACGQTLGPEALKQGDRDCREYIDRWELEHPGADFLDFPHDDISELVCIHCSLGHEFTWDLHAIRATKPVEPTGTSSFPLHLITNHTLGESPGGSLRR